MKNTLLIIDDDATYCNTFKNLARQYAFELNFAHNLEDGVSLIGNNRRIIAVVLDGHCFLEPSQKDAPKVNFVYHALHALDDLEREQQRIIPRCVNTELPAEFREELQGLVSVFDKKGDAAFIFRWLRAAIAELPETKVREAHADIFEKLHLVFNHLEEDELIALILKAENPDISDIPASLASIRRLLEKLTDACSQALLKISSDKYASKMGVSVKPVFDAMYSQRIIPRVIVRHSHNLYSYCSEYGNHISRSRQPEYTVSIYSYRVQLFKFLEILSYCLMVLEKFSTPQTTVNQYNHR